MIINYLILAYDNAIQLKRVILALSTTNTCFYIHIDKKSKRELFIHELNGFNNITYVDSSDCEDVIWADFSTVLAILKCLKLVKQINKKGYCILISEHDYPVKSNREIFNYFELNYGKLFIAANLLNSKNSFQIYNQRIISYKFNLSSTKNDFVILSSIWNKIFYNRKTIFNIYKLLQRKKIFYLFNLFKNRKYQIDIDHFWGSQWWALPNECIIEILEFIDNNPKLLKYYNYTLAIDELFFQTILKNIDKTKVDKFIFDLRPTFMKWNNNEFSPKVLTSSDYNELITLPNRFLFARKFNVEQDDQILNLLDKYIDNFKKNV
jgi:hypothetical protein